MKRADDSLVFVKRRRSHVKDPFPHLVEAIDACDTAPSQLLVADVNEDGLHDGSFYLG